ncbi:hypothetical protein SZ64_13005 [Erythrobacter sp. SG61-1L]|uniref:phage tail assembly chaperone n=1 Tax=Erythrobacter sp. SG61-1L TaxID=1603897 RepID=UPI0006C934DC|nr:phage tail assembly chaperone [Erythrobacter sp. SG61-1L]KPL68937.1 hypothetical protein SZ64_13005 [Erythrobacter sp. SG61-1L]
MSERLAPVALRLSGLVPRLLGWCPDTFWAATPAELAAILMPDAGGDPAPLSRADLNRLMEQDGHG